MKTKPARHYQFQQIINKDSTVNIHITDTTVKKPKKKPIDMYPANINGLTASNP